MKDHRIILSLAIVLFISVASIIMISNSNQTVELTEEQKLFNELSSKSFGEFGSGKYLVKENYISKIAPDTKVADFIKELNEKAVVFENDKRVTSGIIKTGMTLKLNDLTFTLLVTGDLNNDGKLTQIDVNRLIRNIGKDNIEEKELTLSDLNDDGLVTEADVDLGADYLLGKSKLKFKDYKYVDSDVIISGSNLGDGWYGGNVTVSIGGSYTSPYDYEVYGTKEIEKTRNLGTTTLFFDENGAYLVIVSFVGGDGRIKSYSYLIGIDKTRSRCAELGANTLSECMLVNDDVKYTSVEEAKAGIKKKTTTFNTVATTDMGLLMAEDKDGESFYFRGDVRDNFVEFAGYVWRIVRRNGDGSVRLVYNGTSTSATGTSTHIGNSSFSSTGFYLKSLGYKYNPNLKYGEINESTKLRIGTSSTFTFADSYTCSDTLYTCTLSGNKISGTYTALYNKVFNGDATSGGNPYKYVVISSNSWYSLVTEFVEPIVENGAISTTSVMVKYLGYIEQDSPNTSDSTIKTTVDNWYVSNLLNKTDEDGNKWHDYLADNYFCDEKSLSSIYTNVSTIYFKSNERLKTYKPSLVCENAKDMYTVKNGELSYPIGLLTADEVMFAGGVSSEENTDYWLYTGQPYWTMSQSFLMSASPLLHYFINGNGSIGENTPSTGYGVRPVINLSKDVLFAGGSGTAGDPYKVALSK